MALRPRHDTDATVPICREGVQRSPLENAGEAAESFREQARALADATPPKLRLSYARAFCSAVLARYWERLRPRPAQSLRASPAKFEPRRVRPEGMAVVEALADTAATLGVEDASYLIGRTYAAMLPNDYRSENGVYYTPPAVVARLLDSAAAAGVDWEKCRVLDPACGGGAFLGPLARRIVTSLKGSDRRVLLRNLSARLAGYEIDPFAAWMSAVFLDATLNEEVGFTGGGDFSVIEICDSLTKAEGRSFDFVVGNPPYGRTKLGPTLRATYKRSLYGHANLYGIFLDLALRRAVEGGVVAYVTPTGFLSGEYFKNLRALLNQDAPPCAFEFITERAGVFDDVLQEILLAVFKRGARPAPVQVHFVEVGTTGVTVANGDKLAPGNGDAPWILPRSAVDTAFAERLRSMTHRLADWGYGVSTGPLVWNRFKARLRDRKTETTIPLIWAEAVSADGVFAFRADRRNHAPYFEVQDGDDALIVRRPCVLLQRTTAKEQARRLVAAELPQSFLEAHGGAVTVENHLNMIVPITPTPLVDTATLAAFLNSAAADRAFRCISGTVAVSAYELEAMPLPAAWAVKGLPTTVADRQNAEAYCWRLYGRDVR